MKRIILFLQNAWSPYYAGGIWERQSWLRALEKSRSGQRLKVMIDDFNICHNTTPIVGATPSSVIPPDFAHIKSIIQETKPLIIVACGKQAENALKRNFVWNGPLLVVPHPAHRFLTDKLYLNARQYLENDYSGRGALRQGKGQIIEEKL